MIFDDDHGDRLRPREAGTRPIDSSVRQSAKAQPACVGGRAVQQMNLNE